MCMTLLITILCMRSSQRQCACAVAATEGPASKSVPIKHTRPKVQKFDNGFIIEDTHMGPPQGKVGSSGNLR
jgi:hypothetical protein